MALNPKLAVAQRNAALDTALNTLNNGEILILDGTQATDADTAIGAQVTLATLGFSATAWAAASTGSKVANAITSASAVATSTAAWYRMRTSGHTAVWDGSVGTAGANLNFNSTALQSGATVSISGFTATMAA